MKKKILMFGGIGAAVVAIAVVLIIILSGGEKAYRAIIILECEGTVSVKRDGSSVSAYPNMKLRSGDGVEVGGNAFARLKLDGDKYVYLDENTIISLKAEGDELQERADALEAEGDVLKAQGDDLKKRADALEAEADALVNKDLENEITNFVPDPVTFTLRESTAEREHCTSLK